MTRRVVAVLTRDLKDATPNGRIRTLLLIQDALAASFEVRQVRLRSALETGEPGALLRAIGFFVFRFLTLRPIPLQCALFDAPSKNRKLARAVISEEPDFVYLDSVRCTGLLGELRRLAPNLRIVMDMDDLMSARMQSLRRSRLPYSFGYLSNMAPRFLRPAIEPWPTRNIILAFEEWALQRTEREALRTADAIVLVSAAEAKQLKGQVRKPDPAEIVSLAPPVTAIPIWRPRNRPIRFCFVGSDRQLQNREAIDYLLDIWRRLKPETKLHIAGSQERQSVPIANVIWEGLVADLGTFYDPHSVLLYPTLLGGGVKTKVIEAFAYSVPVVAFATAFEGLSIRDYPLCVDEPTLQSIVGNPEKWFETFNVAARMGHAFVAADHSFSNYQKAWATVIRGSALN